jgi:hypothetical protein
MKPLKSSFLSWRALALCLLATLYAGCTQTTPSTGSASIQSDTVSYQRYTAVYQKWRATTEAMPPYSKTTAYTTLQEFSDIVACGKGIVPLLREKIEEGNGMDFVLSIAVVKIMGWPDEQFPTTDMTQHRANVLHRLVNPK